MQTTITRVTRMADLTDELAENVRYWPHYRETSETHPDDAYESMGERWDPLISEGPERQVWRLTGYAEVGRTDEGHRLFVLRMNRSTFVGAAMAPGRTSLTIGYAQGTKTDVETWAGGQIRLNLAPAEEAGRQARAAGRPRAWFEYGPWGRQDVTDPGMLRVVEGVWGLARDRLSAAFYRGWDADPLDRADVTAYRLTLADLDAYAGRQVTADEAARIAVAIDNSTAGDAIAAAVEQVTGLAFDPFEDDDAEGAA